MDSGWWYPSVQDMYTRLFTANLDFDSEHQPSFVGHLLAWVHRTLHVVGSFDENTRFSGHGMLFSWIARKLSCPWYCCCLVDSGVETSVSVFGTIQRRLACPCASVDTHQSRSVVKFYVAQFQRCCVSFSSVSSQGRVFLHSCSQLRTCLADH